MRLAFLVAALFVCGSVAAPNNDNSQCKFTGNMCDVKPVKKCFQHHYQQCAYLHYPKLYETKMAVEFWVKIEDVEEYAENFRITVVRAYNESSWESVGDCCNLRLNETCTLPPSNGALDQIFVPMKTPGKYCNFEIARSPAFHPAWCIVNPDPPCLFLQNDEIVVNESFTGISTDGWPSRYNTDYCFFHAPSAYGTRGQVSSVDGLTRQVEGITAGDDGIVRYDDEKSKCRVVASKKGFNISRHLIAENTKNGYTACVFIRIRRYDDGWETKPLCVTEGAKSDKKVITILTTITAIVILTAAVLLYICRKFSRSFLPSYESSVKEGIITQIFSEHEKYLKNDSESESADVKDEREKPRHDSSKSDRYVSFMYNGRRPDAIKLEKNVCQITPETTADLKDFSTTVNNDKSPEVETKTPANEQIEENDASSFDSRYVAKNNCNVSKFSEGDFSLILSEAFGRRKTEDKSDTVLPLNNNTLKVMGQVAMTTELTSSFGDDYLPKSSLLETIVPGSR